MMQDQWIPMTTLTRILPSLPVLQDVLTDQRGRCQLIDGETPQAVDVGFHFFHAMVWGKCGNVQDPHLRLSLFSRVLRTSNA